MPTGVHAVSGARGALAAAALLVACGGPPTPPAASDDVTPPPAGVPFDYQIGDPYTPDAETRIVSRDREAAPATGLYNICYVNAFQAQPHELAWWEAEHPDLLLRRGGEYVVDGGWDEVLLDISTASKRDALAGVVGGWIDGCAAAGFDAVEPDNLDSHTRAEDLLTPDDAAAFATLLAARAHAAGLAIAQKNDTDLAARGRTIGFDFALSEECARWDECDAYVAAYGLRVLDVEYADDAFAAGCAGWPDLSIVRRDRDVTAPGSAGYRYAAC
ncbi:MAG TPA: endo alpha-1,4 polygalactosaminidase [Acidimicrobiales bacterium]|nr:endo alpha-1,4 polygalactosaminidase [Acidimicrobiales bacterium]